MPFIDTTIEGLKIFEPKIFKDERGYFFESFNKQIFEEAGIDADFVQDNQSRSTKNVLRGLHYQLYPFEQAKLVRVMEGEVLDVAVDIRPGSKTYGKWHKELLSADNNRQFFIPRGFAHGLLILTDTAIVQYKCDNFYSPEHDAGIIYNDPDLNIDWPLPDGDFILSEKDKNLPSFIKAPNNFENLV